MKKTLACILSLLMMLTMLPTVALAAEAWPVAADGVITLDGEKTYGALTINAAVTIEGNGAQVGNISIKTDGEVIIRNVQVETIFTTGLTLYDVDNIRTGYKYDITIENCTFGTAEGTAPFRRIYMPENALPQADSSLIIKDCTFHPATYIINLLRADNIQIENSIFNSASRPALQYTVTAANKDQINISNNTFNGTNESYGLLATISSGTFDSPNGHIGNVHNNTFNYDNRAVIAVQDQTITTISIPTNTGLASSNLWFSAVSTNPLFKPNPAGPVSSAPINGSLILGDNNLVGGGNSNTEVKASIDPTFMIIIPTAVDFGTLTKNSGTKTKDFNVAASGVLIEDGAKIAVSVESAFVMKDKDGTGNIDLAYVLNNNASQVLTAAVFANFDENRTEEGTVTVDTAAITKAGSYKGTMVFGISYVPPTLES